MSAQPTPPASPELTTCFEQGLALLDSGAWARAREMFSRGLALDATRTGLWHNRAWCHLQLGDLAAAQADLQALLHLAPGHAEGLALLARVMLAQGQAEAGSALLQQAWAAAPQDAQIACQALCALLLQPGAEAQAVDRGLQLAARGQLDEPTARQLARVVSLAEPAQALGRLLWPGLCLAPQAQGWMFAAWVAFCQHHRQFDEAALAATLWQRHEPQSEAAQRALMQALADQGDLAALLPLLLEQARALGPNAQALRELAQGLLESRDDALREQGLTVLAHALSLHPQDATLWLLRGQLHATLFQHEAALADCRQALALEPALEEAHGAAACSLAALGQPEQALQALQARADAASAAETAEVVAAQHPGHAAPRRRWACCAALRHRSQAFVLRTQGRLVEAEQALRRSLAEAAERSTEWDLGAVLLTQGRYAEGWAAWRRQGQTRGGATRLWHQALAQGARPWDGTVASAAGGTLLVVAENGLGDTVQFARFLPPLQAQGVQVVLCTQPGTVGLMRSLHPQIRVLETGEPLPQADLLCSVWDLPMLLDVQLVDLARWGRADCLSVTSEASAAMAQQLGPPQGLRVALAWRGARSRLAERSMALAQIAALKLPGVQWFSLQQELHDGDEAAAAQRMGLRHEGWSLEEAAAALGHMDCVVSVDTVFCHLAGALGRPTTVLLPLACDWRWGAGGSTTPWYPQAHLLRQRQAGDWSHPLAELQALLSGQQAGQPAEQGAAQGVGQLAARP